MKNRFLKILLLSVLMVISAVCLFACGDGGNGGNGSTGLLMKKMGNDDTYTVYDYVDDGKLTDGILNIAELAGDKVVGRIKTNAFYGDDVIKTLIVPDTVEQIDEGAFANMKSLEELVIPFVGYNVNADTYYGETAKAEDKSVDKMRTFGYAFGTEEYQFGQKVTATYDASGATFDYYVPMSLRKVTVAPRENYGIPMYAFSGNSVISQVVMDENVTAIGENAFSNMMYLTTIEIGKNVTRIEKGAFKDCGKLNQGFTFEANSTLVKIGSNAFENAGIENIVIPVSVLEIGDRAFKGSKLVSVNLGNVAVISSYAFYNCVDLETVTSKATEIQAYAFYGCESLSSYNSADENKIDFTGVTILDAMSFAEVNEDIVPVNYGTLDLAIAGL